MADEINNVSQQETTNKTITRAWMDEYDENLKEKGLSPLYERTLTPVLDSVPDETVLTYTKDGKQLPFKIGDEARVYDTENGDEELGFFVFYKLYDITDNGTKAVWGLGGSGGGGGGSLAKIRVDLKAFRNEVAIDPSALNGVTVTLTKASDGSQVATGTWAGSVITFPKVPILLGGGTYTLTVSAKTGYSVDANGNQSASITGIAPDMGSDVTYTFNYRTRRYAVSYQSNQGSTDAVLTGKTVGYGGNSYTDTIDVPGTTTIAASDLTPAADANGEYRARASVSGYQITVDYETCVVKFLPTVSDNDGSEQGARATINGTQVVYGGEKKVAYGETVNIVCNAIEGYSTPTYTPSVAGSARLQPALEYQTCVVTVTLTRNDNMGAFDGGTFTVGGKSTTSGTSVKIARGTTNVATVLNAVTGYQTPTVAPFDANTATKDITAQYLTHIYAVRIKSNQDVEGGSQDASVDRMAVYMLVRYTYNSETVNVGSQLKDGDTFKVPADADTSTLAVYQSSNVTDYNKNAVFNHTAGSYGVTMTYSTTLVSVQMASNQSDFAQQDVAFSIGSNAFTLDGNGTTAVSSQQYKMPTGTPFAFSAAGITHYAKNVTVGGTSAGASIEPTGKSMVISVEYDTTKVYLNMVGVDDGVEGAFPTGAQGTIAYTDDNSQTVSQTLTGNTSPAYVPTGKQFTVSYGSVGGYGTPVDAATYTATGTQQQANKAQYVSGVLNIELTANDGETTELSTARLWLTIGTGSETELTGAMQGTKKVFSAPVLIGERYTIRLGGIDGYQTPSVAAYTNKEKTQAVETVQLQYLTTVYTLTSVTTTKNGNVQGQNPQGVGCTVSYQGLAQPVSLSAVSDKAKVPSDLVSSVVITPNTVYGYAASNTGSGQSIELTYATTGYTLTAGTNQSDSATVLAQTVIRVTKQGLSATGYLEFTGVQSATEILVPAGTTITASDISAQSGAPSSASYNESITVDAQTNAISVVYQTEKLSVSLSADEGTPDLSEVTITVTDTSDDTVLTTATGSLTDFKIAFGTAYMVTIGGVEGYATPQFNGGSARTAAAVSHSAALVYEKITVVSDYIILDQTSTDPTTKVLDSNGKSYSTGYTRPAVIDAIRAASHCYVGTFADNVMSLKQLSDTNGTQYADGTSAATDITGADGKNVFMRLPIFFTRATQIETDKWRIEFAFDPSQVDANGNIVSTTSAQPAGSGWVQWGGNDLIGKYEACSTSSASNTTAETANGTAGFLRSRSGVASLASVSQANFKTKARNNGTGFSLVKWRHQNIMAILFYAYYGHTNCQSLIGAGASSNNKNTGLKNSLGMTDTTSSNGNTDNIVFWGLENWWGNKYEWVDNVVVNSGTWVITEDDGSTRTKTAGTDCVTAAGTWVYPSKWILGDNLDLIPAVGQTGGSDSQGYCDGVYIANSASRVVLRSSNSSNVQGGVGCAYALFDASYTGSNFGSRLAFTGAIEIS